MNRQNHRHAAHWLGAPLVAFALIAAACHSRAPEDPSVWSKPIAPATPQPCKDPHGELHVELLDAGRPPRAMLRIAPESGLRMTIPLDTETSLTAIQDGSTAQGTTCYRFSISPASPWGFQVWPPDGNLALTPLGTLFVRGAGRTKQRATLEENVGETFFVIAPRLPVEPVGIGARWRLETAGRRMYGPGGQDTFTYELVEMEGTRIALKVRRFRHEPRQFVETPGGDPDEGRMVDEGMDIEDFWLRLDLERHPLPRIWPRRLGIRDGLRRIGIDLRSNSN